MSISREIESPMYSYITPRNAESLFRHNYSAGDLSLFGCKAVVAFLPGWKAPKVYFFATGENLKSWHMHHAKAASAVLGDSTSDIFYLYLPYLQGYELTAKNFNGQWKITRLDIQSSITNLQKNNERHRPSRQAEEQMLKALLNNIDPNMMSFSIPEL
jgi:hypothetical protein